MPKFFSLAEVAQHASEDDLYIIYQDQVYDVTKFLSEHPGGEDVVLELAGKDATEAFDEVGHSQAAQDQLHELLIGSLDQESATTIANGLLANKTKTKTKPVSLVSLSGIAVATVVVAAAWVYTHKG